MIDRQANKIIEILKKENAFYIDLLELSNKKKTIIIEGKVSELDNIVKVEQNMILSLGQLEKMREQELVTLCEMLNLDGKTNITDLVKHLSLEISNKLKAIQKEMGRIITELQNVNEVNGQLIQQSLDYIDYSINMITSSSQTSSLYEDIKGSNTGAENKRRLFDTKV